MRPARSHAEHEPADDLVRLAERDAAGGQMIREIGRGHEPAARAGAHAVLVRTCRVATMPVQARRQSPSVATASKTPSLSSCMSLL